MIETDEGGGHFTKAVLRPLVLISPDSNREKAIDLHHKAHEFCFIASSVNFLVCVQPIVIVTEAENSQADFIAA